MGVGSLCPSRFQKHPPSMVGVSLAWVGPDGNPGISWENCPRFCGTASGYDNIRVLTQRKQLPVTLCLQNSRITLCVPEPRLLVFQGRAKAWQRDVCSCILPAASPHTSLCHTAMHILQHGRALSQSHRAEELNRLLWTLLGFAGSGVKDCSAMWSHQSQAGNASRACSRGKCSCTSYERGCSSRSKQEEYKHVDWNNKLLSDVSTIPFI